MRICFVTFGCRLNRAESLDLESQYAAAGWDVVQLPSPVDEVDELEAVVPDVVVVRGCSVTIKKIRNYHYIC